MGPNLTPPQFFHFWGLGFIQGPVVFSIFFYVADNVNGLQIKYLMISGQGSITLDFYLLPLIIVAHHICGDDDTNDHRASIVKQAFLQCWEGKRIRTLFLLVVTSSLLGIFAFWKVIVT